ncbi:MAG: hypothetical protein CM1200mP22_29940 [Dehalococcoidia bacterium]|nr:MAG: hypothetical protein CM1200mP22_29940 [Dehalococcoidia bacterium]
MNPDTGALESVGAVEVSGGPAPRALNPKPNTTLYVGRRDGLKLTSYDIDQRTGDRVETGSVGLGGEPCYLLPIIRSVCAFGLLSGGHFAVHPIKESGRSAEQPLSG